MKKVGLGKLIDSGLFNPGLHAITGHLVNRYNECLRAIGLKETKLKKFHVDGIGWSPEIADEKDDPYYLSPDGSVAIIVSLDQKDSVIYFPFFSFQRRIMDMIFNDAERYLRDILERASVVVDINKQISERRLTPYSLLRIDRFSLEFIVTRGLAEKSVRQRELVDEFARGGWFSSELRDALISSADDVGDLRYKSIDIPSMNYLNVDCFYARAFGGVFIFRSLNGLKPLIIFTEDPEEDMGAVPLGGGAFNLHDKDLRDYFFDEELIGVYEDELRSEKGRKRIQRLMDLMLIDGILNEAGKNADSVELEFLANKIARKTTANRLFDGGHLSVAYYKFGEILSCIKQELSLDKILRENIPSYSLLLRPNPELPEHIRNLIWQMIVRKSPFDIFRLFIHDREEFNRRFEGWSDARQDWAVEYLRKNFEPEQVV